MNNLKSYNSFVNEGIRQWSSKKFDSKEMDSNLKQILQEIKNNFSIKDLKLDAHIDFYIIEYDMDLDKLRLTLDNEGKKKYEMYLNGEDVTNQVNQYRIEDIFDFLYSKWCKGGHKFSKLIESVQGDDEMVWSPVIDGGGPFLKSKKMKKSELSKKDRFPYFKESEKKKCDDYVENENELLFANSDR